MARVSYKVPINVGLCLGIGVYFVDGAKRGRVMKLFFFIFEMKDLIKFCNFF